VRRVGATDQPAGTARASTLLGRQTGVRGDEQVIVLGSRPVDGALNARFIQMPDPLLAVDT
jgi:hypothetical protein